MNIRPLLSAAALSAAAFAFATPALAGFESSSFKKDSRAGVNAYAAPSAVDSDFDTCWQSDPEKPNKDQWISLDVPISTVDKIAVVIGWDKSEDVFKDHGRIKSAKLTFSNNGLGDPVQTAERTVQFKDVRGWQVIDIEDVKIDGVLGGNIKLTVTDFFPGVDFPNLAISEVRVHLKEFPAETIAIASATEPLDDGQVPESMIDDNDRSSFVFAGNKSSMTLNAPGYGMASVGLQAGPTTHARPKTVVVKADSTSVTHQIPKDAKGMQWMLLPAIIGYTGSAAGDVVVDVTEVWPGSDATKPLALSEVKINATVIEEF